MEPVSWAELSCALLTLIKLSVVHTFAPSIHFVLFCIGLCRAHIFSFHFFILLSVILFSPMLIVISMYFVGDTTRDMTNPWLLFSLSPSHSFGNAINCRFTYLAIELHFMVTKARRLKKKLPENLARNCFKTPSSYRLHWRPLHRYGWLFYFSNIFSSEHYRLPI